MMENKFQSSGVYDFFNEIRDGFRKTETERSEKEKVLAGGVDQIVKNVSAGLVHLGAQNFGEIGEVSLEEDDKCITLKVYSKNIDKMGIADMRTPLRADIVNDGRIVVIRGDDKDKIFTIYNTKGPKEPLVKKLTKFVAR